MNREPRWSQPVYTHTHSVTHNNCRFLTCVCVCMYIPRDAVMMVTLKSCPICRFPVYPHTSRISPFLFQISIFLLRSASLREWKPPSDQESPPLSLFLSLFSLLHAAKLSEPNSLESLFFWDFFQGLDSFAAMHNSLHVPDRKTSSPVCSCCVVTLQNFWVCMKGGTKRTREGEKET